MIKSIASIFVLLLMLQTYEMLQRIQTIFLLLAAVAMFLLFGDFMSLISVDKKSSASESMLSDGIFNIQDHIILLVLGILAGALAVIAIFMFQKRKNQMMVTRFALIFSILFLVLSGFLFYLDFGKLDVGTEVTVEYGVLSPVLSIIFCALALSFIKKDDKLVSDSNRLR